MLRYAIIFLIVSIVAAAIGLTNISTIARRISLTLFVLFFLIFTVMVGFAYLVGEAIERASLRTATTEAEA